MGRVLLLIALVFTLGRAQAAEPPQAVSLFNGKDLTGWKVYGGKEEVWKVEDGKIIATGGGGGWLMTEKEYGDFTVALEYRLSKRGNSGVTLRAPFQGEPAFTGMEIQIIDATSYRLRPDQLTGALYGLVGPTKDVEKPVGEWNRMIIGINGRYLRVILNNVTILETDLDKYGDHTAKHPGLLRKKGHIGLQSHTSRVEFRNLTLISRDGAAVVKETIPAEFRGRWRLKFYAPEGGKVIFPDGEQFFRVAASGVKVEKGLDFLAAGELTVARVAPGKAPPGKKAVIVRFTSGAIWIVGQAPKSDSDIFVQLYDPKAKKVSHTLMFSPAK